MEHDALDVSVAEDLGKRVASLLANSLVAYHSTEGDLVRKAVEFAKIEGECTGLVMDMYQSFVAELEKKGRLK